MGSSHQLDATAAAASAKAIIDANAYMTIASADADGVPWASPVWFAHDRYTDFLWVSRPDTRHSGNIAGRAEVGLVIFDSTVPEGDAAAVYADALAREVGEADLDRSIAIFSERSTKRGGAAWSRRDVTGSAPHRLFAARARAHFVLGDGDRRVPVTLD